MDRSIVPPEAIAVGSESVAFHGPQQAGIATFPAQAHARFLALDLKPGTNRDDLRRLMRLLSDDAARMMAVGRRPRKTLSFRGFRPV